MIRSKKILNNIGDSRHPCRTPTKVRNYSPTVLCIKTALVAFGKGSLMVLIRFWPILNLFMASQRASIEGCRKISEDMVYVLLILTIFLVQNPIYIYLFFSLARTWPVCRRPLFWEW